MILGYDSNLGISPLYGQSDYVPELADFSSITFGGSGYSLFTCSVFCTSGKSGSVVAVSDVIAFFIFLFARCYIYRGSFNRFGYARSCS